MGMVSLLPCGACGAEWVRSCTRFSRSRFGRRVACIRCIVGENTVEGSGLRPMPSFLERKGRLEIPFIRISIVRSPTSLALQL